MSLMILPLAMVVWRLAYGPVPREEERPRRGVDLAEFLPGEPVSDRRR